MPLENASSVSKSKYRFSQSALVLYDAINDSIPFQGKVELV